MYSVFRTSAALCSELRCWSPDLSQDCTALSAGGGTDERQSIEKKHRGKSIKGLARFSTSDPDVTVLMRGFSPLSEGPSHGRRGNAQSVYCGKDRTRWHVRAVCARVDKAGRARCAWIQLVVGRRRANRVLWSTRMIATISQKKPERGFLHDFFAAEPPLPGSAPGLTSSECNFSDDGPGRRPWHCLSSC